MQFTKLRTTELKHSDLNHFCIQSFGNNFTIENPVTEAVILQLNNEPDVAELFPFVITSVDMPREQLATNLLKSIDMRKIYDNSSVEEQQEFGLDPIFIAECSVEPTKSRLLQAQHSSATSRNSMLAIISTYGACQIFIKNPYDRLWKQAGNLTKMLINEVFPICKSPTDLKTFVELKDFVNFYVMTACTWHNCGDIIYTANAAGYIIAFKIEYEISEECAAEKKIWKFLSKISTDLGRISYLKAFDDYLIAVSINGIIRLFKFNEKSNDMIAKFESSDILWSHKDQMCCQQIVAQKCKNNDGYMISYAKGAHLICMKISDKGKVEGNSSLYIPGIKITGLELFHENELILTTIAAKVMRVTYSCIRESDCTISLHLKADPICIPNLDVENMQILGVGATTNKALWIFMTHYNKEMPTSLKQAIAPSYLMLYKPSNVDPLAQLNNIPMDTMDPYHDLILALRIDIWHSNIAEKYNQYYSIFSKITLQKIVDENFLRKMQIQLEILRAILRRSSYKMQNANEIISAEIEFMEVSVQITHILLRLEYLQGLIDNKRLADASAGLTTLTEFQQKSAYSMRKHFYVLTEKLKTTANETTKKDVIKKLKPVMLHFVEMACQNLHFNCQDFEIIDDDVNEKCLLCHEHINYQDLMCTFGHNLRRCCVSFVQLPWFNNRICLQCGTMALERLDSHDALVELFPPMESVKCTFCRSAFVYKEAN